jgi:hypothetical protein
MAIDRTTDHETFYGPWKVLVVSTDSDAIFFTISGSDSADGTYPGVAGETIGVAGDEWLLRVGLQALDGERLSGHLRRTATCDVERGLLIQIAATIVTGFEFVALRLELQCEDPAVNPPSTHPPEFSFPGDLLVETT